jgi:hypothetical protein
VTVVRFRMTEPVAPAAARARFGADASHYLDVPGLLWKAYLVSDDGATIGGAYWWRDRASAEAQFTSEWRDGVTARYGAPPTVEWFDAPVVVDGRAGAIRTTAPISTAPPPPPGDETREG